MAKTKTSKAKAAIMEPKKEVAEVSAKEEPVVEAPEVRQGLNAKSHNKPLEPVVKKDTSSFDYKGIEVIVKEVVDKHFTGDKKLGFKAISNQLRKMLN